MTHQYNQPPSQRQSIPASLLASHVHPNAASACPFLKDAASLAPGQFDANFGVDIRNHHALRPMPGHHMWCTTVSPRTSPIFRPDVGMLYTEPREASETAHEYFPPVPTNNGVSGDWDPAPRPTNCPTTHTIVATYPSTRVSFRKKTRPAADYTSDVQLVMARCTADGGDPAVVRLLPYIFPDSISTKALTRYMTQDEAREHNNGAPGQVFRVFLRKDEEQRFCCYLCAGEGRWKNAKDALRHLKRDHFGLGICCDRCGRIAYTTGELTRHRCVVLAGP